MAADIISSRLAQRLKQARKSRNLSLDALAKLSGVSRSMLSQIERGESSPTVASLWNLTNALNIDFSGLLDGPPGEDSPIKKVVRAEETPVIHSQGKGCEIRILSSPEMVGETEIYDLQFAPGGKLDSEPHRSGCMESLAMISGELIVESDGVSETLKPGDSIRYIADKHHAISAKKKKSRAILIVTGS